MFYEPTVKGTFLSEAEIEDIAYIRDMRNWAKNYTLLCSEYNKKGNIDAFRDKLPKQLVSNYLKRGIKPRKHQIDPLLIAINTGRLALFAGMGRGKTFMGGYYAAYVQQFTDAVHKYPHNQVLIVCPKSAIPVWTEELPKFFNRTVSVYNRQNPDLDGDIVITNFAQLGNIMPYKNNFCCVVIDESDNAKNPEAATVQNLYELCSGITYRMVMTGTPVVNDPRDAFTQLTLINPYAFGYSYEYMVSKYFTNRFIRKAGKTKKVFKAQYAGHFNKVMQQNTIIQPSTSKDVNVEPYVYRCKQTANQKRLTKSVANGYIDVIHKKAKKDIKRKLLKAELQKSLQVSSGFLMAEDQIIEVESNKINAALAKVKELNAQGEKVIIWTVFQHTTKQLLRKLHSSKAIYGASTNKQRATAIKEFKEGDLKNLILQVKSGSAALNLQVCCKNVYVEYPWTAAMMQQSISRTARSGQTRDVELHIFYTENTSDELALQVIKKKEKLTSVIMQNYLAKQFKSLFQSNRRKK